MKVPCAYCGKEGHQHPSSINRAKREGLNLYCDRKCAGLGRRSNKTKEQLKEEKRIYDKSYRAKNLEKIKADKKIYFQKDYAQNPEKYKAIRKAKQASHNEYCRTPEYKAWKKEYDLKHRAKRGFGEFWESALILRAIDDEMNEENDMRAVRAHSGRYNKSQIRKRKYYGANSEKLKNSPLGNPGRLKS